MSRVIKFRAWDKVAEQMSPEFSLFGEFTLLGAVHLWQRECGNISKSSLESLGDLEVMQFTGLKDKNGVEIFEGDIIRKDDPCYWVSQGGEEEPDAEDLEAWRGGTGHVVAIPFGYIIKEIDCGNWTFNGPEGTEWSEYDIEVIGNIYQHL